MPIEKFLNFKGGGRNGKGFVDEFMKHALGDYFGTLDWKALSDENVNSTGTNVQIAQLSYKRYVVANVLFYLK